MNRRTFLTGSSKFGLGVVLSYMSGPIIPAASASRGKGPQKKHDITAEEWMTAWMSRSLDSQSPLVRGENGALYLGRFVEPIYFLYKSIEWTPNPGQERFAPVTVPVGFVTDLASIPRIFFSLLRPDGEYTYPAIVHDYLYWTQTGTRENADQILKMGMEDFKVDKVTIATIYNAVRAGGDFSWKNNAKLRKAGEKRVLKELPTDPKTRWADWKKTIANFGDL
jgi:uncharacterized protein DUF1353